MAQLIEELDAKPYYGLEALVIQQLTNICDRSIDENSPLNIEELNNLGVDYDSASSLRSQLYSLRVKKNSSKIRNNFHYYLKLWEKGGEGNDVVSLARHARYPPYLFVRILIENVLKCSRQKVSEYIKNVDDFSFDKKQQPSKLRIALFEALNADNDFSPAVDQVKRIIGVEYEFLLQRRLIARQIPFESEDELRDLGLAKTPDIRLSIPIAIQNPRTMLQSVSVKNSNNLDDANHDHRDSSSNSSSNSSSSNSSSGDKVLSSWVEIRWIDSKAMFGHSYIWEHEHKQQIESYVHRYGAGLVIYWSGYEANLTQINDVVITNDFPYEILFPGDDHPSTGCMT